MVYRNVVVISQRWQYKYKYNGKINKDEQHTPGANWILHSDSDWIDAICSPPLPITTTARHTDHVLTTEIQSHRSHPLCVHCTPFLIDVPYTENMQDYHTLSQSTSVEQSWGLGTLKNKKCPIRRQPNLYWTLSDFKNFLVDIFLRQFAVISFPGDRGTVFWLTV